MNKKLHHFIFPLLMFVLSVDSPAQVFDISNFEVKLQVNPDASIAITESITVIFHESRHGIFRDIPFSYSVAESSERAENHPDAGSEYKIRIRDLDVKGEEFQVSDENGNKHIRIGSPDKYVNGQHTYTISYTVYGALSFFSSHVELNWNVTGNESTEIISAASVHVTLPGGIILRKEDCLAYRGPAGSADTDLDLKFDKNIFDASVRQQLLPREGMTIALRMPRSFFSGWELPLDVMATAYLVKRMHVEVELLDNGTLDVRETFLVDFTGESDNPFIRILPDFRPTPGSTATAEEILEYEVIEVLKSKDEFDVAEFTYTRENDLRAISIDNSAHTSAASEFYVLHYRVWNAWDGRDGFISDIPGEYFGEPIEKLTVQFKTPSSKNAPNPAASWELDTGGERKDGIIADPGLVKLDIPVPLIPGTNIRLRSEIDPNSKITISEFPKRLLATDFYFSRYHVEVVIAADGSATFSHSLTVVPVNEFYGLSFDIPVYLYEPWVPDDSSSAWQSDVPSWNMFGKRTNFLLHDFESSKLDYSYLGSYGYWVSFLPGTDEESKGQSYDLKYVMEGLVSFEDGSGTFAWPVFLNLGHPADNATFRITFPEGSEITPALIRWTRLSNDEKGTGKIDFSTDGNVLQGKIGGGLFPYESIVATANWSCGDAVCAVPFFTKFLLWYENNWPLVLPVFFGIPLFLLWIFIGRDKPFVRVVQFYPPQSMTSAEAGMLIDNKLHRKDLISLIFYWGNLGILKITESGEGKTKEITLEKTGELNRDAKTFEKTIFEKLFGGRKSVTIERLKDSFYMTINEAMRELESYGKKEGFFVWGTRGFGAFLRFIGMAMGILTIFLTAFVLFEVNYDYRGAWDVPLGYALSAIVFYWSGKRMPRFGKRGYEEYQQLDGFREFIEKAEKEKLRKLVNEDASYFGHTLSFAIVFGLADKWAEKFSGILDSSPDWYLEGSDKSYNALRMINRINRDFSSMRYAMTSSPSASSGGSRSYSGGGFSSRSFGGSNFGSRGGSSGGGFGGGKVGSW